MNDWFAMQRCKQQLAECSCHCHVSRCCVDDDFANITSWCKILATVRICSRATLYEQSYSVIGIHAKCKSAWACVERFFQLNFDKILGFQHGFSESFSKKFRFSRDSAKFFAVSRDSAKVSAKIIIQQGFSEIFCCQREFSRFIRGESKIGDKSVKYKLYCFCYWPGSYFNQYDSRPWRPVAKDGEGCFWNQRFSAVFRFYRTFQGYSICSWPLRKVRI